MCIIQHKDGYSSAGTTGKESWKMDGYNDLGIIGDWPPRWGDDDLDALERQLREIENSELTKKLHEALLRRKKDLRKKIKEKGHTPCR